MNDKHLYMEFKNEILTLSAIEHLNLVKLLGYLEHKDERIIVVEYVGNGTLRLHLDGKSGNRPPNNFHSRQILRDVYPDLVQMRNSTTQTS